jgi:hypothetical protein
MRHFLLPALVVASLAAAFSKAIMDRKRDIFYTEDQYRAILKAHQGATESNCGPIPCLTFDEKEQYIDVTPGSEHEYVAPGKYIPSNSN